MTIAVIIPCYRVKTHIIEVISNIGVEVSGIYVVDDGCPEKSGCFVEEKIKDERVKVIYHQINEGVGAAVMTGYKSAIADGHQILIKLDGDGQMDPKDISRLAKPIQKGQADYSKGNRFYFPSETITMPKIRFIGNLGLSFITKIATGYWKIFDPTNGFTAIHSSLINYIPLEKISKRYFFESDMLFRLGLIRAHVIDVPIQCKYGDELSNLNEFEVAFEFLYKNFLNLIKRIIYTYYVRDFSIQSIQLILGLILMIFGILFGTFEWHKSYVIGKESSAGTVMLSALPIIIGFQLLLNFLAADIALQPSQTINSQLENKK